LLRHTNQAHVGAELHTRLADGIVQSRVEGDRSSPLAQPTMVEVTRPQRKRKRQQDSGPGLFGA
jgi:hypothetical protein